MSLVDQEASRPIAPPWGRVDWLAGAAVVVVALLVRLVYLFQLQDSPYFEFEIVDAAIHDQWAKRIAAGQPWNEGVYFRAPLYPWFLGAVYKLTGGAMFGVRLVQLLLGAINCGLVFGLARQLVPRLPSIAAGIAMATYWVAIFYDAELLIPVLSTGLNLLAVIGLFALARRPSAPRLIAAGLALGLSAIARPNVLLFAPLAFGWLLWTLPRWRTAMRAAAIYTAAVVLPIAPVTAHNIAAGEFVLVASQGGVNLYIGNNPQADGMHVFLPGLTTTTDDIYAGSTALAQREAGRPLRPGEVSKHYSGKAFAFMRAQPGRAFGLFVSKARYFWSHKEILNNKHLYVLADRYTPLLKFMPLGFWLVGPLGMLGLFVALRDTRRLLPLSGFVLAYMLSVVLFFVNARFRLPTVPFLIVLGAYGVVAMLQAWKERQHDRLGLACAGLLVGSVLAAGAPAKSDVAEAVALERLGATLFLQGRHDEAFGLFQEAIDDDPDALRPRYSLARAYDEAGRTDEAIDAYASLLEREPDNLDALRRLGLLRLGAGDAKGALDPLQRAATLRPDRDVEASIGRALLEIGDLDEALRRLGAPESVGSAEIAATIGERLIRGRRYDDAGPWLERAVTLQATERNLIRLALLRATAPEPAQRDCDEALDWASQAVEASGRRSSSAFEALGAAQAECGDFDAAVRSASTAMRLARELSDREAESKARTLYQQFRQRRPLRSQTRVETGE